MTKFQYRLSELKYDIQDKQQLSTVDIARLFNLCDVYIKEKTGRDILTIYETVQSSPEEITRYLILLLFENEDLMSFFRYFENYDLANQMANAFYNTGNKKILMIDDFTLMNSNKSPEQMPYPEDEQQIRRIFRALRRNYQLYEKLYKDKVWLINSTTGEGDFIAQEKIKISPYTFFHLLGFDKRNLNPRSVGGIEFSRIFPNAEEAKNRLASLGKHTPQNVYYILEELIKCEEEFLDAALEGRLSNAINIDKIEMKCFSFERLGFIETASGMVYFNKDKAIQLGYGNEVQHISSDIILLNDIIRKYSLENMFGLDFIISPFSHKKENGVSDQQSIFITKQRGGGFNSHIFDGQLVSVSSSVAGYRENDFNFSISEKGGAGGTGDAEPIVLKEFSEEERAMMAQTIMDAIPGINKTLLKTNVKTDSYGNKTMGSKER